MFPFSYRQAIDLAFENPNMDLDLERKKLDLDHKGLDLWLTLVATIQQLLTLDQQPPLLHL